MKSAVCLVVLCVAALAGAGTAAAQAEPGDPPYEVSDANAGTTPIRDPKVLAAFHGEAGIGRIVDELIVDYHTDKRLADIFHAANFPRLRRMLYEQFCYILGGPCHYTGRDMRGAHADQGLQTRDFNALVEDLQSAMTHEHVAFWAQDRLIAKLAPMKRTIVTR